MSKFMEWFVNTSMTVENFLNACEMRIEYVDIEIIGNDTLYYGLTEDRAKTDFCTCLVVSFDYDVKTYTLALTVKG